MNGRVLDVKRGCDLLVLERMVAEELDEFLPKRNYLISGSAVQFLRVLDNDCKSTARARYVICLII